MIGIDISTWQDGIDFAAARRGGIEFCVLKAGGSNSGRYTDSKYRRHEPAARAAGMLIGHYWFNGTGDPAGDADYFVNSLSNYQPGDLLVLDVENEGSMPAWSPLQAYQFCVAVRARLGVVPALYMSASLTRQAWDLCVELGCVLWVASYGANTGSPGSEPTNLGPWPQWTIWQYTSNGSIAGYPGRVDLNTSRVPIDQIHHPKIQEDEEEYDMAQGAFYQIASGEGQSTLYHQEAPGYPLYPLIGIEWTAYAANKNSFAGFDATDIQALMRKVGVYQFDDNGRRVVDPSNWTGFKVWQPS